MKRTIFAFASTLLAGFAFSIAPASAVVTHTTSNRNLRAGPGTHYDVKVVIPAGSPIDIESCGHSWCYMGWGGHVGYVNRDYLIHYVTQEVYPLVHVTHLTVVHHGYAGY